METAVQKMAIGRFLVLGLSHLIRPRAWAKFVVMLRSRGEPGAFICGIVYLWVGESIVGFHQVWHGIPIAPSNKAFERTAGLRVGEAPDAGYRPY